MSIHMQMAGQEEQAVIIEKPEGGRPPVFLSNGIGFLTSFIV